MRRSLLICAFLPLFIIATCFAQAPIERRPPATSTALPSAWDDFTTLSASRLGTGITVLGGGRATRCVLDEVTPDGLYCHFDVGPTRFLPLPFPNTGQRIPRQSIDTVRAPDKAASTLLGIGIGFAIGAGAAAASNVDYKAQNAIFTGALLSVLGGYIGHGFPLIHHTLYRALRP